MQHYVVVFFYLGNPVSKTTGIFAARRFSTAVIWRDIMMLICVLLNSYAISNLHFPGKNRLGMVSVVVQCGWTGMGKPGLKNLPG